MNDRRASSREDRKRRLALVGALLVGASALVLASCEVDTAEPRTATARPAVKEYSAHYLNEPVQELSRAIEDARAALRSSESEPDSEPDPHAGDAALARAADIAAELTGYYLPVTAARDHLIRAYQAQLGGDLAQRDDQLAAAEEQLTWVVEHSRRATSEYASELLTVLTSIELHKDTSSNLLEALRSLCEETQTHLLKAPLVLRGNDEDVS
jgi:hypothetical protein